MCKLGLQASLTVAHRAEAATQTAAKAELQAALHAGAHAVLAASCSLQAALVARLAATGQLADAAAEEEEAPPAELSEDEACDGELDPFADDDEEREEWESAGRADGLCVEGPVLPRHYAICVVPDCAGVRCVPPLNPHAHWAHRGSHPAGRLLNALRSQFAVYRKIALWLEEEKACDKGSVAFWHRHKAMTQKAFAKKHGFDPHAVSKALDHARLAWSDASLPLKALFLER